MRQSIELERETAGGAVESGGAVSAGRRPGAATASGFKMASVVAAGFLLSRIAGLVRESVFARYFGNTDAADSFKAPFRIPNILQNLFGEGVLSASFIPVYSRLLAAGEQDHANEPAWTLGAIPSLQELLLPDINRQQAQGKEVAFRSDAALVRPEVYEAHETRQAKYAIGLPANANLERKITELLKRPAGRPSHKPLIRYNSFFYPSLDRDFKMGIPV